MVWGFREMRQGFWLRSHAGGWREMFWKHKKNKNKQKHSLGKFFFLCSTDE